MQRYIATCRATYSTTVYSSSTELELAYNDMYRYSYSKQCIGLQVLHKYM